LDRSRRLAAARVRRTANATNAATTTTNNTEGSQLDCDAALADAAAAGTLAGRAPGNAVTARVAATGALCHPNSERSPSNIRKLLQNPPPQS